MPLSDQLKHVTAGKDRPSASQQNIIVDILKPRPSYHRPRVQFPCDIVRIEAASYASYEVVQIDDIVSIAPRQIVYSTKTFVAPNADDFEILICSGWPGMASFGYHPIMAKVAGTSFPAIGALVGPKHGQAELYPNYPGFRFLGESNLPDIGWVIRDRGIATGQGQIITSSGQTGTPSTFELDTVSFSSGFNGWDGTTSLEVVNVFSDTAAADLIVQFKWDANLGAYVSTDVECA